ncbi:hypothetical protein SDC9_202218 [bioreactor metagenome]|uniref:Uncharacterized protein n=1 Tax=bioreactor metagenome TaxID=1076179 RepID=A0A645ITR0_9ZZZZ
MRRRIDLQAANLDRFTGQVRGTAAQHGAHPSHQFLGREGFGHVIVGAGVETLHLVFLMDAGGQHDDRNLARPLVGAQLPGQRDAGLAGQHPVEDDQIG